MYDDAGAEYPVQASPITSSQFKGQVTLRAGRHGRIEKAEHGHNSAHHVVDAEILYPQHLKHHAARIERDRHEEKHPDIEQQGILGDAPVVGGGIGHKKRKHSI